MRLENFRICCCCLLYLVFDHLSLFLSGLHKLFALVVVTFLSEMYKTGYVCYHVINSGGEYSPHLNIRSRIRSNYPEAGLAAFRRLGTEVRPTLRWREQDSNHRSPRKGQHFFETAADLATTNRPGSHSRILTIDKGRFTVRQARLAPAMISTPGHRASRRRQRGALAAGRE